MDLTNGARGVHRGSVMLIVGDVRKVSPERGTRRKSRRQGQERVIRRNPLVIEVISLSAVAPGHGNVLGRLVRVCACSATETSHATQARHPKIAPINQTCRAGPGLGSWALIDSGTRLQTY